MNAALKLCKTTSYHSSLLSNYPADAPIKNIVNATSTSRRRRRRRHFKVMRASIDDNRSPERRSFLTLEEAGIVEMSGLSSHEAFLCRLTISSLNLLRVIGEQEGCSIEELNAGKVCDWFVKDKLKREQNLDPVLQWDESDFQL
ncbi:hypothetical protein QVD17_21370 [Tagetes erecta]|uniref:Uncharacterized protein n=1 Tax=Tagetes erecta TaxID=13708 RepID=A0AAD8NSX5_TARER|nr:hypothetical protein QVD17_21370 [Tagetes erecta]